MLDFRAEKIQTKSAPANAGTKHLVTEVGVSLSSRGQAGDADAESESKGGGGQDGFKEGFHCRSPQNCFR